MAIIITLSVIGFISYNGYVRDARNATREAHLKGIVGAIDQFIFTYGRAPLCRIDATTLISGPQTCYFTPFDGSTALSSTKATAFNTATAGVTIPSNGSGVLYGVDGLGASSDWTKLQFKSNPTDPRGPWYLYATNGGSKYAVFATKEDSAGTGYSTIARGSVAMLVGSPSTTDVIKAALGFPTDIYGWRTTGGSFQFTAPEALLAEGSTDPDSPVPYSW